MRNCSACFAVRIPPAGFMPITRPVSSCTSRITSSMQSVTGNVAACARIKLRQFDLHGHFVLGAFGSNFGNIFIPLTNLCRNRCSYCTFAKLPDSPEAKTFALEEVDALARSGRAHGCIEALAAGPGMARRARVTRSLSTSDRVQLTVYRSLKHMYAQLVDDVAGTTLVSVGTTAKALRDEVAEDDKTAAAKKVGTALAKAGWGVIIAGGLILGFVFFNLGDVPVGKTLNAVFFERVTTHWPGGAAFVLVALTSEALILLVAAQTGFLDGPRVLANMALDRWLPSRLALLSDRLVTGYGIVLMGTAALLLVVFTRGEVGILGPEVVARHERVHNPIELRVVRVSGEPMLNS